jgi:hypothetical protein
MRVLICGGRDFADVTKDGHVMEWNFMNDWLDEWHEGHEGDLTVIHGAAKGADLTAHVWAHSIGAYIEQYPANWERYGKKAGYLRNKQMLEEGKPDLVIAFPGGAGTANMKSLARRAGVPVEEVKYEILIDRSV